MPRKLPIQIPIKIPGKDADTTGEIIYEIWTEISKIYSIAV